MPNRFDDEAPAAPVRGPTEPASPATAANRFDDGPAVTTSEADTSWPAYLKEGTKDFFRAFGNYGSFGLGARGDALIDVWRGAQPDYGTALKAQKDWDKIAADRSPIATTGGNLAGGAGGAIAMTAATGAVAPAATGAALAARMGGGLAARMAGFGAEAAGQGALQGAGHTYSGNPIDYAVNAAKGGALAFPFGAVGGAVTPKAAVMTRGGPTQAQAAATVGNQYRTFSQLPVTYSDAAIQRVLNNAGFQMQRAGAVPANAAAPYAVLENLRSGAYGYANPWTREIGPQQIELARQALSGMRNGGGGDKSGLGATHLRNALDHFAVNAPRTPGAVTNSPALGQFASNVVQDARANAAGMYKARDLEEAAANAALKYSTSPDARNIGEQLIAKGQKILQEKGGRYPNATGYSAADRAALAQAITPTATESALVTGAQAINPARWLGVGNPGGVSLMGIPETLARNWMGRGVQGRVADVAQQFRNNTPMGRAGNYPAYNVGPGMGNVPRSGVGAATVGMATPYDDGREALAAQMMREYSPY